MTEEQRQIVAMHMQTVLVRLEELCVVFYAWEGDSANVADFHSALYFLTQIQRRVQGSGKD